MLTSSSAEKKSFLKNVSWLFGGEIVSSLFAMLETVALARFLGLEQFGLFSLVVAYVNIVKGVLDFKVKGAVIKYVGRCRENNEKGKTISFIKLFYLIDFLTGALAFLAAVLLAGIADRFFIKSESAFELVFIYSFALFVSTVNTSSRAILEVFEKFGNVAVADTFGIGVRVGFVLVFLAAGFGIKGAFTGYVAATFLHFSVLQFLVNRALVSEELSGWLSASIGTVANEFRNVLSFVMSLTVSAFLNRVLNRNFPILVLGHFFTSEISGLYKASTAFSKVVKNLKSPVKRSIYPALVRLEQHGAYGDFKKLVFYSIGFVAKFFVPVGAICFIFADDIISIFFGTEFAPAANAMRIFVVVEVLSGLSFWTSPVYLSLGRTWFVTMLSLLGALFYTVSLFYLSAAYSFEGAALARLAPYLVTLPAAIFLFREIRRRSKKQSF